MSGVDDEALDEVGVLEEALAQQQVVLAHGHALAPLVQDAPVEAVDLRRRHVALHRRPLKWPSRSSSAPKTTIHSTVVSYLKKNSGPNAEWVAGC